MRPSPFDNNHHVRSDCQTMLMRRSLLAGWLLLTVVYAVSASWDQASQFEDSLATAFPAWHLVERGDLDLSKTSPPGRWYYEAEIGGLYSNRSPGLIAVTAAAYTLVSPFVSDFVMWPATLLAVIASSTAVLVLAISIAKVDPKLGIPTFVLLGLGTAMWSISADQIWPHGPSALAVALAVWLLTERRLWWAGIAFGLGILVRPPIAVLVAVIGFGIAWSRRSWRPLIPLAIPSLVGAALLLAYNRILWGSFSPLAAYGGGQPGSLGSPQNLPEFLPNLGSALFSPQFGVLIWSLWLLIALVLLPKVWSAQADWMKWTPLAALFYVIVHAALNRSSGGLPYGYRYAIEAVVILSPIAFISVRAAHSDLFYRTLIYIAGLAAVSLQVAFIFIAECTAVSTANTECYLFGL